MGASHHASSAAGQVPNPGSLPAPSCDPNSNNGHGAAAVKHKHNGHAHIEANAVSPHLPDPVSTSSPAALGSSLAPALLAECEGRLSQIEWFRAVWQRSGAATGFARWHCDDGREVDVLVKVPVGPVEFRWTVALGERCSRPPGRADVSRPPPPTPRIYASGSTLGGHDLAWLVMERMHGHTLAHGWSRELLEQLLRAAAQMQARASKIAPLSAQRPDPPAQDWDRLLARSRQIARDSIVPEAQHWNDVVKKAQKMLPKIVQRWEARPIDSWCHGDLHPGNAMRRRDGDDHCVLIDLALVHPGHWVEDAVYLERQFWGRPEGLFGIHPVSLLAHYRREAGLPTEGDYGAVANLRRVLMAACAPVHVAGDGHPRYLHAALETLERLLPQVGKKKK